MQMTKAMLMKELKERDEKITRLMAEKRLAPFVKKLGGNVMSLLAATPYENWPAIGKAAMHPLKNGWLTAIQEYKSLLPKKKMEE